jgi:hypothetical protein
MSEEMHDLIEAYLDKRMKPEEEVAFKLRLKEDEALRDLLVAYRIDLALVQHIQYQAKREKLNRWQPELKENIAKRRGSLLIKQAGLVVASLSLVAVALYWAFPFLPAPKKQPRREAPLSDSLNQVIANKQDSSKDEIAIVEPTERFDRAKIILSYASDAQLDPLLSHQERGAPSDALDSVQQLLADKQIETAKGLLTRLQQQNSPQVLDAAMLLGFYHFQLQQFDEAEPYFQQVSKYPGYYLYRDKAEWFLALSYLAQTKDEALKQLLNEILQNTQHIFYRAAQQLRAKLQK